MPFLCSAVLVSSHLQSAMPRSQLCIQIILGWFLCICTLLPRQARTRLLFKCICWPKTRHHPAQSVVRCRATSSNLCLLHCAGNSQEQLTSIHGMQVPMDQGAHSLAMIHKFTRNEDLATVPARSSAFSDWALMLRGSSALSTEE